jgi:hypothetical protein
MRKRLQIAFAVSLVVITAVVAFQVVRPQEHEPVYQGKPLSAWLREYAGWDIGPAEWALAKRRSEIAVRQIGTNAIPALLRMIQKMESPRMSRLIDLWDQHFANRNHLPTWIRHPSWYKNQARYLNMEGEIGFKILGASAEQAVPALISVYESTLSMDSVTAMNSRIAVGDSLIDIGPAAIPYYLRWVGSTNEAQRLTAVHALSQIHSEPSVVVPVLVNFLSHTSPLVRTEVAEGLGNFGTNAQQALPALVPLLSDSNHLVRRAATDAFKQIDPEAAARTGVK